MLVQAHLCGIKNKVDSNAPPAQTHNMNVWQLNTQAIHLYILPLTILNTSP